MCWDAYFIHVKLNRALRGRDGDDFGDHPVQNDWNGSAKVALISIERSPHAWRTLAVALNDDSTEALADGLEHLQRVVLEVFQTRWRSSDLASTRCWARERARRHDGEG